MLWHRIYGSIKFCLSRPARCFHFDLTLILVFYAQTSRRCIGIMTDRHIISSRWTRFFFTFDFIQTECVLLSQTGNKSRRLRLVLVFCPRNQREMIKREKYSHIYTNHKTLLYRFTARSTCFIVKNDSILFSFHYYKRYFVIQAWVGLLLA